MIEISMVSSAANWIYQRVLEGKATDAQREAIRERLRREATYNLEILRLLESAGVSGQHRARALDLQAMAELVALPVPPGSVLRTKLGKKADEILRQTGKPDEKRNQRHLSWARGIQSEADLFERLWLRLRVYAIRAEVDKGTGDLAYLRLLLQAWESTLRAPRG